MKDKSINYTTMLAVIVRMIALVRTVVAAEYQQLRPIPSRVRDLAVCPSWKMRGNDITSENVESISMSNDGRVVAFASIRGGTGTLTGTVSVYDWLGGQWGEWSKRTDIGPIVGNFGVALSISNDGTVLAIGASNRNYAAVHKWDGQYWTPRGKNLKGLGGVGNPDRFGSSVSLSDEGLVVAIGGNGYNDMDDDMGHVLVYEWKKTGWSERGNPIEGEIKGDQLGVSVSMSNDGKLLAVGATGENKVSLGYVRVYEWVDSEWSQRGENIEGAGKEDDSGFSISLSDDGTVVAIGSPGDSGYVRVYEWDVCCSNCGWSQRGEDIKGVVNDESFGNSVSLSDDGIVVAIGSVGSVRVYEWDDFEWLHRGQKFEDVLAGPVFLSDNGAVVASQGESDGDVFLRVMELKNCSTKHTKNSKEYKSISKSIKDTKCVDKSDKSDKSSSSLKKSKSPKSPKSEDGAYRREQSESVKRMVTKSEMQRRVRHMLL